MTHHIIYQIRLEGHLGRQWTDWFDGYLARKLDQMTPLGKFLDPVADKLMVAASMILLVETYETFWLAVPALVIISREIVISALREWMANYGNTDDVQVSFVGKAKTFAQLSAIFFLILGEPNWEDYLTIFGYLLLYISVFLTIWSMFIYFFINIIPM